MRWETARRRIINKLRRNGRRKWRDEKSKTRREEGKIKAGMQNWAKRENSKKQANKYIV